MQNLNQAWESLHGSLKSERKLWGCFADNKGQKKKWGQGWGRRDEGNSEGLQNRGRSEPM
jgi:hypothetical protein